MPVLLLILLLAVLGYMWITRRNSTLTRACRWRQERAAGQWRCVSCGAVVPGGVAPRDCLRPRD
ncbi:hypothetical protein [Pseudorhodobacter sp. MZDSW-24AT]|uniref:hypothetical protein n=1 Tax=Pseudorhodobacter sp. MZDSW-24AT TaxID=2052957 RepID=UPI000C1E8462|nr:hypothetical protein [Pseudorhodobacter sp. MZDSW-24AT]PJF07867.1 hypothetical protein CUR21_16755 [Pseudorhodobacter sp. MZDSW-24AT]